MGESIRAGPPDSVFSSLGRGGSNNIDWTYIRGEEQRDEDQARIGFVPSGPDGPIQNSGVTIAHGIDLGGRTLADLRGLNLDEGLVQRLRPYLGHGHDRPPPNTLRLTPAEVNVLDQAVDAQERGRLVTAFDAASRVGRFDDLPAHTQTALMDVFFQHGTHNPARAAPDLWRQATTGDWEGAHANLMDFGDVSGPRRRRNAGLLQIDMNAGTLPRPR